MTRILVVDDNERNRYMAEVLLSKNGYQVEMAANGAEALEKARHMPPDLVLADILMPVMDGYSLCREWKQDARLMSIPFVVYTATYTDPEDEKFALALGAARFIVKPIDPEGLLVIIQEVLDQFQSGQLRPCAGTLPEEDVYLRQYNQTLIHKLEDKLIQLETAKQTLEDEIKLRKQIEGHLVQAQKMEAIGTLAGGIAHDFNNILAAVIGFTELAMDGVENGSLAQNNLQEVLKACHRAKELVLQILTFSRQHEQEQKPINIMHIAKEALKLMRASLPAIIEIRDDMKSNSPVNADPTQIHQVLMNLCTNAGHAMQEKGGTLKVELSDTALDSDFANRHPNLTPGAYVKLTVSDTGCGMSAHVLERIFDPFFFDQSRWRRHRHGSFGGPWHRQKPWRHHHGLQRAGPRYDF